MGPASRRETIDDYFGDWNHKKVIGMGVSLLHKMKNVVPGRSEHVWNFIEFSNSLPADSVLKWLESLHQLNAAATPLQQAKIQERKSSLRWRINAWTTIQHLYMPEVSTMHSTEIAPSDFPLHLPSSLPAQTACLPALQQHEFRLCEAQAYESLDELRDHLCLWTHMYKYKNKNIVRQHANTRCQNIISTVQDKANTSVTKYHTVRAAIVKLLPHCINNEGWCGWLLPLAKEDICALKEGEEGESEGRRSLSWIWRIVGVGGDLDDEGLQEALHIKWCRSCARAMCWLEEVLFLCEEMRRVLAFLEWHAGWWDEQENMLTGLSDAQEGVVAYASMGADHDVLELNTTASMAMLNIPPEEPSS
ncbi:hypothetical protein PILCRDRAFT_10574 [Piloderma croceum F 1598]|uniref:Uncharacterized protein n=1 Tax=Piloderma croceum (strain F 1598) TaxID=765440 RepID=A0A0C3FH69_PILCF|nr:hypothetical protein PILCRDRAFT_10574 [Piloderma croceum F 1598]